MQPSGRYATEVANGAAWLDAVAPGWELKIDLSTLNMRLGQFCICGQLFCEQLLIDAFNSAGGTGYGVFLEMCIAAGIDKKRELGEYYGFEADESIVNPALPIQEWHRLTQLEWDDLSAHWIALIKDRLDQGVTLGT